MRAQLWFGRVFLYGSIELPGHRRDAYDTLDAATCEGAGREWRGENFEKDWHRRSRREFPRVGSTQSTFAEPNVDCLHPTLREARGVDVEQLAINDASKSSRNCTKFNLSNTKITKNCGDEQGLWNENAT